MNLVGRDGENGPVLVSVKVETVAGQEHWRVLLRLRAGSTHELVPAVNLGPNPSPAKMVKVKRPLYSNPPPPLFFIFFLMKRRSSSTLFFFFFLSQLRSHRARISPFEDTLPIVSLRCFLEVIERTMCIVCSMYRDWVFDNGKVKREKRPDNKRLSWVTRYYLNVLRNILF